MRIIQGLWLRLNSLIPEPKCKTFENDYDRIEWFDTRSLPSAEDVESVDLQLILDKEQIFNNLLQKINNRDLILFKFIVQIIDVGLAKGIWVAGDFNIDVKNEYLNIKNKLTNLGLL